MGVEEGGPSEEDLKIRPGEPEERVQNVDEARDRANASNPFREQLRKNEKKLRYQKFSLEEDRSYIDVDKAKREIDQTETAISAKKQTIDNIENYPRPKL